MRRAAVLITIGISIVGAAGLVSAAGVGLGTPEPTQQSRDGATQPAAVGSGLISGVVDVDGPNGPEVLRHALVTINGASLHGSAQLLTDDDGRFSFGNLLAGSYSLAAEKPGFVKTYYGSRIPARGPSRPVALADGQRATDLRITLLRGAVITGTVYSESHQPIPVAQVHAELVLTINGERKSFAAPSGSGYVITDERGIYRIYGLVPGDYRIYAGAGAGARPVTEAERVAAQARLDGTASSPAAIAAAREADQASAISRTFGYAPGNVSDIGADVITVAAGEERTGVDIIGHLIRVATIEGIAAGPDGQPLENVMVAVVDAVRGTTYFSPGGVRPDAAGHFKLAGLRPGTYRFVGRAVSTAPGADPVTLWTSTDVPVNEQDVSNVVMSFQRGMTVAGTLTFRGARSPIEPGKVLIRLTDTSSPDGARLSLPPVAPKPDGTFAFDGIAPGKYRLMVDGAPGWVLRSAVLGNTDTLDEMLDVQPGQSITGLSVLMTDQTTLVSGTLLDALGHPAPGYTVMMFPTNREWWTSAARRSTGAVKVDSTGKFSISGLPPGQYYLCALTDADPAQLREPSVLEQLAAAAITITLGEGEHKQQDVKIGG